ncbi:surface antigen [Plasmodium falciparum UGT5.1]|uniref:Surface antigen n=1 Tax=Plasmodium falciparum UGT5.1 TaxID=1237627 RepID=W7JVY8_PLAFA|nr:surface antigen [Plasmodium falciparum UGT5.1]
MDKFATLHTDIQSYAIPTCVCEKSMTDKVEKTCLKCGGVLGGGIAPSVGLLGTVAIDQWTNAALLDAAQKGIQAGIDTVVAELESLAEIFDSIGIRVLRMINKETYRCPEALIKSIYAAKQEVCDNVRNPAPTCHRVVGQDNKSIWFGQKVLDATKEGIDAAETFWLW